MNMEEVNGMRVLKASEGNILKQGYIYSEEVWLGCNADENEWVEIDIEEYEQLLKMEEGYNG